MTTTFIIGLIILLYIILIFSLEIVADAILGLLGLLIFSPILLYIHFDEIRRYKRNMKSKQEKLYRRQQQYKNFKYK